MQLYFNNARTQSLIITSEIEATRHRNRELLWNNRFHMHTPSLYFLHKIRKQSRNVILFESLSNEVTSSTAPHHQMRFYHLCHQRHFGDRVDR